MIESVRKKVIRSLFSLAYLILKFVTFVRAYFHSLPFASKVNFASCKQIQFATCQPSKF